MLTRQSKSDILWVYPVRGTEDNEMYETLVKTMVAAVKDGMDIEDVADYAYLEDYGCGKMEASTMAEKVAEQVRKEMEG